MVCASSKGSSSSIPSSSLLSSKSTETVQGGSLLGAAKAWEYLSCRHSKDTQCTDVACKQTANSSYVSTCGMLPRSGVAYHSKHKRIIAKVNLCYRYSDRGEDADELKQANGELRKPLLFRKVVLRACNFVTKVSIGPKELHKASA